MASPSPSVLSLSAAGLYTVVLMTCVWAAWTAARRGQPRWHWLMWSGIALAFALLALARITGFEELLREMFRSELKAAGSYDQRRSLQRPLAVVVIFSVVGLFVWAAWRQWRANRGRRNHALLLATAGMVTMVLLMGLRIVSLHQIDGLLYGPAKLNWIIDIGASLGVLAAAIFYYRLVNRRI